MEVKALFMVFDILVGHVSIFPLNSIPQLGLLTALPSSDLRIVHRRLLLPCVLIDSMVSLHFSALELLISFVMSVSSSASRADVGFWRRMLSRSVVNICARSDRLGVYCLYRPVGIWCRLAELIISRMFFSVCSTVAGQLLSDRSRPNFVSVSVL